MKKWIGLIALGLVGACGPRLEILETCDNGFYTSTEGQIMQWPDGQRVDFQMHKDVPAKFSPALATAAEAYNQLFSRTTLHLNETNSAQVPSFRGDVKSVSGDGLNAVYWVDDGDWVWAKSDPLAVAMTVVNFAVTGIQEADVFFKASTYEPQPNLSFGALLEGRGAFLQSPATSFQPSMATLQEQKVYMIGVHELGHAVGRCHSTDYESIMYATVNPANPKQLAEPFGESDVDTFAAAYQVAP